MTFASSQGPTRRTRRQSSTQENLQDMSARGPAHAMTSSLDQIQIVPRTPKMQRPLHTANGVGDGSDEVELSLLGEAERLEAANGLDEGVEDTLKTRPDSKRPLSTRDKKAMALLIVLCS
jgi:MFS transporter, PAT family, solute carrier family 33 (acetyl-CoA transportor), member 1